MKFKSVLFLIIAFPFYSNAQTDSANNKSIDYSSVEQMPEFPGGEEKLFSFIEHAIKYPAHEATNGISGKVLLSFFIEPDGSITHVHVVRGVLNGPGLDEEAKRVVLSMPKWVPGKINGKEVRVSMNLPIGFLLGNSRPPYELGNTKINPTTVHYNAGVKYFNENNYEEALNEFNVVLEINSNDLDGLYNRGILFLKMNRKEEACSDWNKIKQLGNPDADALLKKYCQ